MHECYPVLQVWDGVNIVCQLCFCCGMLWVSLWVGLLANVGAGHAARHSVRRHRFVFGSLLPSRTITLSPYTLQELLSKVMVYPASQNMAVERREEWARPGTMCARVACLCSHGIST